MDMYMLQELAAHLQVPNIEDTEAVAQHFDVTPFRLWVIFQSVDANDDGRVTKEELVTCLEDADHLDAKPLRQVLAEDDDREHYISFPQFCRLIRYLWLRQLLNENLDWKGTQGKKEYTFDCFDYAGTFYAKLVVPGRINSESRSFYTASQPPQAKMRWIDLPSSSAKAVCVTVLRLAVKYRFHPTSIEDVLELEDQQPKVNSFEYSLLDLGDFNVESIDWIQNGDDPSDGEATEGFENESDKSSARYSAGGITEEAIEKGQGFHYFVVIPLFELTQRSAKSMERVESVFDEIRDSLHAEDEVNLEEPLVIEIKEATLAMFVASDPDPNLLVTVSSKWRPTRVKPLFEGENETMTNRGIWRWPKSENKLRAILRDNKSALDQVKHLLEKRYSIQRHRSADWLMHAIIDAVVDNLRPISTIYEAQLEYMSARLMKLGHRWSEREVKEVIVMKRDLEWLYRELRPLQSVIRHLIDDKKIGVNVKHYLEDVEDHLNQLQEELVSYSRECERMKDEFSSYQDRRMNDVLYVLTLVTTMIVPAQFLTGYFGMNFENENGDLGSPLLNLGSVGLAVFWVVTVVSTLFVAFLMHRYGLLERPRN